MEQTVRPKFTWRWYYFALIGGVLLGFVCLGGIVMVVRSPQFVETMRELRQSLGELTLLQRGIAQEFEIPPAQVGVFVNVASTSSRGMTTTVRSLRVDLTNTALNDLGGGEQMQKAWAIAKFASDHYSAAAEVNEFCVVLIRRSQIGFVSSSSSQNMCYSKDELSRSA